MIVSRFQETKKGIMKKVSMMRRKDKWLGERKESRNEAEEGRAE